MNSLKPTRPAMALLLLVAAAMLAAGCGSSATDSENAGNSTDAAFAAQMIPHHQSAIAMADVAKSSAQRQEIKKLADQIATAQATEIKQMQQVQTTLSDKGVTGTSMGMSDAAMGMSMDPMSLKTAKPFDRSFIDMMIPHHRGAIAMANVELAKGANSQLRTLAKAIIVAQNREIAEMQGWRMKWYGAELDVTGSTGTSGQMNGQSMDHGSMH